MPEHNRSPFAIYLDHIDGMLSDLPGERRESIRRELMAHLEDAAARQARAAGELEAQTAVLRQFDATGEVGVALRTVHYRQLRNERLQMWLKRCFDVVVSLCLLWLFAPLLVAIAVLVRLDSSGPIFYRDRRIGKNGEPFRMYKFRSMVEREGGVMELTRIGRFLRRVSLDEIPQLFNVLKGDMSLIGPRPLRPDQLGTADARFEQLLAARPGVSGLSQVTLGYENSAQRLDLELRYVRERSFWLDLKLLFRTFRMLVRSAGPSS